MPSSNGYKRNWAEISVHSLTVTVTHCEECIQVDAIHTRIEYGAVYDPDDGLPLSYEGERLYGDGRLFPKGASLVAEHKI